MPHQCPFPRKPVFSSTCRHSLEEVFGMINDTLSLQGREDRLGKKIGSRRVKYQKHKALGGPTSSLCEVPLVPPCCVVLQCLSGTNSVKHNNLISCNEHSLYFIAFFWRDHYFLILHLSHQR